ncbi:hypothetical protein DIPPA_30792 [Diplonema papillatum]|nr:hypothetical protein DIPPA_30792 [Diplonema papillatum]
MGATRKDHSSHTVAVFGTCHDPKAMKSQQHTDYVNPKGTLPERIRRHEKMQSQVCMESVASSRASSLQPLLHPKNIDRHSARTAYKAQKAVRPPGSNAPWHVAPGHAAHQPDAVRLASSYNLTYNSGSARGKPEAAPKLPAGVATADGRDHDIVSWLPKFPLAGLQMTRSLGSTANTATVSTFESSAASSYRVSGQRNEALLQSSGKVHDLPKNVVGGPSDANLKLFGRMSRCKNNVIPA